MGVVVSELKVVFMHEVLEIHGFRFTYPIWCNPHQQVLHLFKCVVIKFNAKYERQSLGHFVRLRLPMPVDVASYEGVCFGLYH